MLIRVLLVASLLGAVLGAPQVAVAAEDPQVRVFQRKPFLRRERVELAPWVGMTINDALIQHYYSGLGVSYHISEQLAVGISGAKAYGDETALYEKVQGDFALNPVVSKVEWFGTAEASYALAYGKFILFNSLLVHLDTSAVGGVGVTGTSAGSSAVTFDAGVFQRFFLSRWLTLNLGLKHYMHLDEVGGQSGLFHSTVALVGASIWAPDFEYRELR